MGYNISHIIIQLNIIQVKFWSDPILKLQFISEGLT